MIEINNFEMISRLVLSLLLGAVIGWQREKVQTAAGLRTHMLVTMGSTLFTLISFSGIDSNLIDSTRIAAGVVTGIGFLGAGTIIRYKDHISGLSTAASIWTAAAIGLAVGYGMYLVAVLASLLALLVLMLDSLEKKFFKTKK